MSIININKLSIEGFSPNCLMGVTGAVAKYKYSIANINRLYFHHSYIYEKNEKVYYDSIAEGLNVWFSRELPISKDDFSCRLYQYYGLVHQYKAYSDFGRLVQDLDKLTNNGEPVMLEIDFYFMKKHRFYHKVHDQHMMIVYGADFEKQCFHVFEAVFGHVEFAYSDYKDYFNEVVNNRKREIYALVLVQKELGRNWEENKICLQKFREDIDKTLKNLLHDNTSTAGIGALVEFRKDFLEFIQNREKSINSFFVPGLWVFMCDGMNCINFIDEFKKDYPDFPRDNLAEVKKHCTVINRKWYYITMGINEVDRYKTADYEKALNDIVQTEKMLIEKLSMVKQDILNYQVR